MTTQLFLDTVLNDKAAPATLRFELGTSTYLDGKLSLYLVVEGVSIILDDAEARRLCEAFAAAAADLGFNSQR